MKKFDFFAELPSRASTRIDRAVLILSYYKYKEDKMHMTSGEISKSFELAHLARPNQTVLSQKLQSDRRVSYRNGKAKALHTADQYFKDLFPEFLLVDDILAPTVDRSLLTSAPFIDEDYIADLEKMAGFYEALHVLENSIRGLIAAVLNRKLGEDWWNQAANNSMKQKHDDRLIKESSRKWLPARSSLGPLYSIDWSDLITLIRKYEVDFIPFIGEIDFMHRYRDLGLLRHVIAHNGFVDDVSEMQRVTLALRDWNIQVAPIVKANFG